jgi:hypothetical protein
MEQMSAGVQMKRKRGWPNIRQFNTCRLDFAYRPLLTRFPARAIAAMLKTTSDEKNT